MSEDFSITLDIDEDDVDVEVLQEEITDIVEVEKIEKVPHMGIGICLLLVIAAPLVTEIVRKKAPDAIKRFKEIMSDVLVRSRGLYQKIKLNIKYKTLKRQIKSEEEIDQVVEELINFM